VRAINSAGPGRGIAVFGVAHGSEANQGVTVMHQKILKVLLVEDNPDDVLLLRHYLAGILSGRVKIQHFQCLAEVRKFLSKEKEDIDVILLDVGLPDSQGLNTFTMVHQQAPKKPIIVLSDSDDANLAIHAVRQGAQDYLVKGAINEILLARALRNAVERGKIEEALRRSRDEMEARVQERTAELALANETLKKVLTKLSRAETDVRSSLWGFINAVSMIIETRDPYTAGHQKAVADISQGIARRMGLPEERIEGIIMAATVHDLGKISIPAEILAKPGRLTDIEMSIIRIHPQSAYDILKMLDFPWPIAKIVLQHHERIDGSGYPQGLGARDILLEAKIIGVADVVEALCAHRPYRPAQGVDEALMQIRQNKGILYDPQVVDACLQYFAEKKLGSLAITKESQKGVGYFPSSPSVVT
jgi:putative two-component system response regulator